MKKLHELLTYSLAFCMHDCDESDRWSSSCDMSTLSKTCQQHPSAYWNIYLQPNDY